MHYGETYTERGLHVMRESFFVALLDCQPFLLERGVIDMLEKALEFKEILEPDLLRDLECLSDEA